MVRRMISGSRRSQAALEYVHTYGWVMLTVLVLGGSLIYYNVSHAQDLVPKECTFLSGLECLDMAVQDELFRIVIVNGAGFSMTNMTLRMEGTCNSTANTSDGNPFGNPAVFVENQKATFTFECQNLTNMRVFEVISLDYTNVDTGQAHVKLGKLQYIPGE